MIIYAYIYDNSDYDINIHNIRIMINAILYN